MIELIFLVCSMVNTDVCAERTMTLFTSDSLMSCMMQGPPRLARWADEHPDTRIARFRCGWPDQDGKDI
jgi:hypothetical protein